MRFVVCGDWAVGKSTLISHAREQSVGSEGSAVWIELGAADTETVQRAGLATAAPGVTAAAVCYSVTSPESFLHALQLWVPEMRKLLPDAALVLVGLQADTRDDKDTLTVLDNEHPIEAAQGAAVAARLGIAFAECSHTDPTSMQQAVHAICVAAPLAQHTARAQAQARARRGSCSLQ
eukprot:m.327002 g.327002  ORF g.327002 m.327002 type:complete len:178 (-) comp47241_c0_seq1:40-573(-)